MSSKSKKNNKYIYHVHHIVPRHMGGTDDPSNLKRLTVEQHAKAHLKLYKKYGKIEDWHAWRLLQDWKYPGNPDYWMGSSLKKMIKRLKENEDKTTRWNSYVERPKHLRNYKKRPW